MCQTLVRIQTPNTQTALKQIEFLRNLSSARDIEIGNGVQYLSIRSTWVPLIDKQMSTNQNFIIRKQRKFLFSDFTSVFSGILHHFSRRGLICRFSSWIMLKHKNFNEIGVYLVYLPLHHKTASKAEKYLFFFLC